MDKCNDNGLPLRLPVEFSGVAIRALVCEGFDQGMASLDIAELFCQTLLAKLFQLTLLAELFWSGSLGQTPGVNGKSEEE